MLWETDGLCFCPSVFAQFVWRDYPSYGKCRWITKCYICLTFLIEGRNLSILCSCSTGIVSYSKPTHFPGVSATKPGYSKKHTFWSHKHRYKHKHRETHTHTQEDRPVVPVRIKSHLGRLCRSCLFASRCKSNCFHKFVSMADHHQWLKIKV